jgi:hypothetical protein
MAYISLVSNMRTSFAGCCDYKIASSVCGALLAFYGASCRPSCAGESGHCRNVQAAAVREQCSLSDRDGERELREISGSMHHIESVQFFRDQPSTWIEAVDDEAAALVVECAMNRARIAGLKLRNVV